MSKVKFTNPPLLEISFVVEFEELVDFSSVHFGLYWETIKSKFPKTFDEEPIFYENNESSLTPLRRVFFLAENSSKFIQLQNNIFVYNWRKTNQSPYSNFETIFQEFSQEYNWFKDWWENLDSDNPESQLINPLNYRINYVNIIDRKSGWLDSNNYSEVFTFLSDNLNKKFKFPEVFDSKLFFMMPNELGLLEVVLQQLSQIQEEDDKIDIVSFSLEAISHGVREFALETWYQSAHEYIVECFLNLTQDTVKEKWGIYYE